jgi:RNA polymerase sigma-54 factor
VTAIRQQVHEAALLVDLVARRERTLLGIAEYVVEWQRERVLHGRAEHRALTRREVAVGLGLHPSTVSRAVHHKHLQLPTGQVIAFADLFGGSTGAVEALREILDHSGRRSDRELAALLADRGFTVARRTVAKYRTLVRGSARRTS